MRGPLIGTLAACFAVTVLMGATPALSMPADAALSDGNISAGVVQDVAKRRSYSKNWRHRPYYRNYSYGYRPYGYRYRPYAYYDYPYYYRRPGLSLWFGF